MSALFPMCRCAIWSRQFSTVIEDNFSNSFMVCTLNQFEKGYFRVLNVTFNQGSKNLESNRRNLQTDPKITTVLDAIDYFDRFNNVDQRMSANVDILNGQHVSACSNQVSISPTCACIGISSTWKFFFTHTYIVAIKIIRGTFWHFSEPPPPHPCLCNIFCFF